MVTAQKREENVSDVPIAIQAFSSDQLDALGVLNPNDLKSVTPGLQMENLAGFNVTYLRGVGSDAFLQADPSVALYIDNVYFPFACGLSQQFGALDRIEVLKGPQGTLFGRNAVGGAINIVTKSPNLTEREVSLQALVAQYDETLFRAYISQPITDTFAVSVSGISTSRSHYQTDGRNNVSVLKPEGDPLPREEALGGRIKTKWVPTDWLELNLNGFLIRQEGVDSMFTINSQPSVIAQLAGVPTRDDYGQNPKSDRYNYLEIDNKVLYGDVKLNTGFMDIRLLASDQYIKVAEAYDFDGSAVPLVGFEINKNYADIQSLELQLLSNRDSWMSEKLTWTGGVYYFHSRQGIDDVTLTAAGTDLAAGTLLGQPIVSALATPDLLNFLFSLGPIPSGSLSGVGLIETTSLAEFLQVTYDFNEYWGLTLGGRYQEEKRHVIESTARLEAPGGDVQYLQSSPPDYTTKSFSPKLSLQYRPFDGLLTFLSWQEATKGATYNVINFTDTADFVKPEKISAYELGFKGKFLDNLVRLEGSAFYYDQKNLQVQFISLLAGGAVTFENAGSADIKGMDFDLTIDVLPDLLNGVVLTASGALLDGTYTDYPDGSGYDGPFGTYRGGNDYSGNQIVRTPKRTARVGLNKIWTVKSGEIELAGDTYYNSGYYFLASNAPNSRQQAYSVFNARIGYFHEDYGLRLTLFVNNLLDERYSASKLPNDFGVLDHLAPPRVVGIRANVDF